MTGVYCTNGHPLAMGQQFCTVCGAGAMAGTPPGQQPPGQQPPPAQGPPPGQYQPPQPYVAPQPQPPRRSNTGILILIGSLVVAAAAVAIVLILTGGDDETPDSTVALSGTTSSTQAPVASSSTSTSVPAPATTSAPTTTTTSSTTTTSTTTTTTTTLPPPATVMNASWRVTLGGDLAGDGGQEIYDVVATEPGYLAVGLEGFTATWTSPDGDDWTQQSLGAEFDGTQMTHVERAADGTLVGVGRRLGEPHVFTAWTSIDGQTWTEQAPAIGALPDGNQVVNDFIAHPGGFVAVGRVDHADETADATWWASPNGMEWYASTISETGLQQMLGVTVQDGVMVAVGETRPHMAAWVAAPDGDFTRIDDDHLIAPQGRIFAWDVAPGGPGYVAVGTDQTVAGNADAAVWTSPDGWRWTRLGGHADEFGGPGWEVMDNIIETGGTLVALGRSGPIDDPDLTVWESTDGLVWRRGAVNEMDDPQRPNNGIGHNNRLLVVGATGPWNQGDGAVWSGIAGTAPNDLDPAAPWRRLPRPLDISINAAGTPQTSAVYDLVEFRGELYALIRLGDDEIGLSKSGDGVTWEPIVNPVLQGPDVETPWSMSLVGDHLYIAGQSGVDPTIWRSSDGANWEPTPSPPGVATGFVLRVVPAGDRLIALTTVGVWGSDDGVSWSDLSTTHPDLNGFGMADLGGQSVIVGRDGDVLAAWTSPSGATWTRVPGTIPGTADFALRDVIAFDGHAVVIGNHDGKASVFVSEDLASWRKVELDPTGAAWSGDIVDGRLIIAGQLDSRSAIWSTADLNAWTRTVVDPTCTDCSLLATARFGDRLVAGGSRHERDGIQRATIWVGGRPEVLRIQAIRVADDDGGRQANAAAELLVPMVEFANRVYAPAGIQFEYDPATDFTDLYDTNVNNSMGWGLGDEPWDPVWLTAANAAATQHPDRLVVFYRHGPGDFETTWAFSWHSLGSATMPSSESWLCNEPMVELFAHELGHYFGLWHPFWLYDTREDADAAVAGFGGDLSTVDPDGLPDTPPDIYVASEDYRCSGNDTELLGGFEVAVPRHNIMSYYHEASVLTPQQIEIVQWVLGMRLNQAMAPLSNDLAAGTEIETIAWSRSGHACWTELMGGFGEFGWKETDQFFCDTRPPGTMRIPINIPSAGAYDITLYGTYSYTFGIVSFTIDGERMPWTKSMLAPQITASGPITVVRGYQFTAGQHFLDITVHSGDPGLMGFDQLVVTPTP